MTDYDDDEEEEEEDDTQQSEIEWGDTPRRKRFTDSRSAFVLEVGTVYGRLFSPWQSLSGPKTKTNLNSLCGAGIVNRLWWERAVQVLRGDVSSGDDDDDDEDVLTLAHFSEIPPVVTKTGCSKKHLDGRKQTSTK